MKIKQEEEDIINPEDVDPSIGRFRNLVQTAVIPNKKQKVAASGGSLAPAVASEEGGKMRRRISGDNNLYDDLPDAQAAPQLPGLSFTTMTKLGLSVPNPAPEVDIDENCAKTSLCLIKKENRLEGTDVNIEDASLTTTISFILISTLNLIL